MSVKPIIQSLKKLIEIHNLLFVISEEKTELLKEGTIEKLQQLLVKERKYIRLLEQSEERRQHEVEKWAMAQQLPLDKVTITYILETMIDGAEKDELSEASEELVWGITKLKQQESLNQTLLNQSMQFVQLSLDLLNPSISNMNYGKQKDRKSHNRSLFDSQA